MKFNLRKGRRYRASLVLGYWESGASNDTLKRELEKAGFSDIVMSGKGYVRYVTASWNREDALRDIPHQVHEIKEVEAVQKLKQPDPPFIPDVPEKKPQPKGKVIKGPVPWWKIW